MRFYLGTHKARWLGDAGVALFVSHRTLRARRSFPRAVAPWALDSGAFTALSIEGAHEPAAVYAAAVRRYAAEVGRLEWCAPQDWMCEPFVVARTGLTVAEHQARTVANYLELAAALGPLVRPVLQGWTVADYHACADRYEAAGVTLEAVGVGSICRRQNTAEVEAIVTSLAERGYQLHAFGVSTYGLRRFHPYLTSSDSMAWSQLARHHRGPMVAGCTHRNCSNCPRWALRWRAQVLQLLDTYQASLFPPPGM